MKTIPQIALLFPILMLSVGLYFFMDLKDLTNYNSSFVSIALAIATFSISFSFLQYQFSPYKALLRSISQRHLLYCYLTVLIALIPLAVLIIDKSSVPLAGIFCVPILVYTAILMPLIAIEETDPRAKIVAVLHKKNLIRFLTEYKLSEAKNKEKSKELEFTWPDETPMHSITSRYNYSTIQNDPFELFRNIVDMALKNGDQMTYKEAINNFFILIDACIEDESVDYSSGFRFSMDTQIRDTFEIILNQAVASKNIPLISFLVYATGDFVKEKALKQLQTEAPYNNLIQILVNYAKTAMESNRDCVIYITSLCRELAQKGIYDPDTTEGVFFFRNYLTAFPQYIKAIGQEAVRQKNSDIVYRCLEDLGFLGCSSVKQDHFQIFTECLQGLVQLGRETRANDVRCFWRHCALDMVDHADQRIGWMLSWLPKVPAEGREEFSKSFSTAYSRLHGKKHSISLKMQDEKLAVVFTPTEEKHIEEYFDNKYYKSVDYSDIKEIKEFKLY